MGGSFVALLQAGGFGTRLYPATRSHRPKQFLTFGGDSTLLERTLDRVSFVDEVVALTIDPFVDQVREVSDELDVITAPEQCDTGPALTYAAHELRERYENPTVLFVPVDQHVSGDFEATVTRALRVANETDEIVTVALEPRNAGVGYGYVDTTPAASDYRSIENFVEKPDAEAAQRFVEEGWLWHAGFFASTPDALLRVARRTALDSFASDVQRGNVEKAFEEVEPVSIEHAVLEHLERGYAIRGDLELIDIGSWSRLEQVVDGSLSEGLEVDATGNLLASDEKHITVVGIDDLVVAAYDDRVVVVPKDEAEKVKDAVEILRTDGRF